MSGTPPEVQLFPQPEQDAADPTHFEDDAPTLLPMHPVTSLRVLHVINGEHYSGAERVQDLLAVRLPGEGIAADLVALKPGRFAEVRRSSSRFSTLPMKGKFDFRVVGQLKQLVRRHKYQVLHAHTPRTALVTAIAARSLRMPWVYHVHSPVSRDSQRGWQNRINSWVEHFSLRSATRVIVVSPTLEPYMRERGVSDERLACVPNGVPTVARRTEPKSHASDKDGTLTIGMVALFRPRKGTEVLIDAVAEVLSRGHNVRLRLIGGFETPEYQHQITQLIAKRNIRSHVELTGFTTDVANQLETLDAMALPSLYGEGLPMVVLEAMAAGVPVIASQVEGASTAIEHGKSGLLVAPSSVCELSSAIEQLATGAIDARSMAQHARTRHAEQFSDVAMARGVATVYRELLEETTAGN